MDKHKQPFKIPACYKPSSGVIPKMKRFFKSFSVFEREQGGLIILQYDKRSEAYYINCHLNANDLISKADLNAVLDPNESEEYKLNREIYTDSYAFKLMEEDALKNRSFEDLVVEYDNSYRPKTPLKVFGGQHRIEAIKGAVKNNVITVHGVRIYFDLSRDQKFNIALVNNTSIAVSNDLLDRMQEDVLGNNLRDWCQKVGLLDEGQNFADKRSPKGFPTVRIARTFLVNYYLGKKADDDCFHSPIVCKSGPGIDENYKKLREVIIWSDKELLNAGKEFAKLHKIQRERVLNRRSDNYLEFANKSTHPCITASWSYASGFLQKEKKALKNHYALSEIAEPNDPLNAKALLKSRFPLVDHDSYRGLGARISSGELGRMLEVFLLQATKAKKRGITLKLGNAAIKSYEAKRAKIQADKAVKGI